jgi:hypothetical protein
MGIARDVSPHTYNKYLVLFGGSQSTVRHGSILLYTSKWVAIVPVEGVMADSSENCVLGERRAAIRSYKTADSLLVYGRICRVS